jgi:hypothetical protein
MRSRIRIKLELSLAFAVTMLGIVTIRWRDWIESVFRFDPDHHNGSLEWALIVGLFALATGLTWAAHYERRRLIMAPVHGATPHR